MTDLSASIRLLCGFLVSIATTAALAQSPVNTEPSKKTLEDAAAEGCDGVSTVIRRCADQAKDAAARDAAKRSDDALTQSRAKAKEAFDRRDRRASDNALEGKAPVPSSVGAERLGGVEVTGKADGTTGVEDGIQKALTPPAARSNGDGTTTKYAPNGIRYDCIEKCVGPACCVELRSIPDPSRVPGGISGR
jgi:hypothetical protein